MVKRDRMITARAIEKSNNKKCYAPTGNNNTVAGLHYTPYVEKKETRMRGERREEERKRTHPLRTRVCPGTDVREAHPSCGERDEARAG